MHRRRRGGPRWWAVLWLGHVGAVPAAAQIQEWPFYGGDPGATFFSPLADVDTGNVADLRLAWSWEVGGAAPAAPVRGLRTADAQFEATPIMVGDTLFLSTPRSRAVALDAATGRELWRFDPQAYEPGESVHDVGLVHRGVATWTDGRRRTVFLSARWRLVALDAATGRPLPGFGRGGEVNLADALGWQGDRRQLGNTSPPTVVHNLVIVGSSIPDELTYPGDPPGAVLAFDARTGRLAWTFRTIPQGNEPGAETWADGSAATAGHVNVWAPMTADTVRGLVYAPVGSASNDWYGARRPGTDLFAESLVCLDARTGRRKWHFQIVHHGLWDYDPAAPPVLLTVRQGTRRIDAVALAGKTGFLYVFDRVSGTPLWPIEERPVPTSDVPGERAWPTQPFPTKPAPFTRQGFGPEDVVDFTPALRRAALEELRPYRFGPVFSPPSLQGTLVMPGWIGGAPWGGGAYDPEAQVFYARGNNLPVLARLIAPPAQSDSVQARYVLDVSSVTPTVALPSTEGWMARLRRILGFGKKPRVRRIPIAKPPYGTLTAIDLGTGEQRWQVPVGDTPEVRGDPYLRGLHLPPLGFAGTSGPLLTRGGLILISGGSTTLAALNAHTGAPLWSVNLGKPGYGTPMTYRTRAGRQFIVVATGGVDGRLMGFALPRR